MDARGGCESRKVHVGKNGLSWDKCSVGNWGTGPSCPPPPPPPLCTDSSLSSPRTAPSSTTHHQEHNFTSHGFDGQGLDAHHHLTCLKLGKRQYCKEASEGTRKERTLLGSTTPSLSSSTSAAVPRCQVEGCSVALAEAKDYHKRHKVCELHSKAPRVIVHGLEQRFCQQCSRFHVTSEFDDAKRSCRRRLAGHNERRRKSSNDSITRHPLHDNTLVRSRFPFMPPSISPGRALSLLSAEGSPWVPPYVSYRSSSALRELIAENRAALHGRQMLLDRSDSFHVAAPPFPHPSRQNLPPGAPVNLPDGCQHRFHGANPHVTLDLMQVPRSLESLPGRSRSNRKEEEECCEIWKSLAETHVA